MKLELIVIAITAFFIYDIYKDQQYSKMLKGYKKYYQMAGVGFVGLSLLVFAKKHPFQSKSMLGSAAEIVKHLPIDKDSADLISPLFALGKGYSQDVNDTPQYKRMMNSGGNNGTKRSVSETKKKFVASRQDWRCNGCGKQLPAWFEVDHIIRLDNGGSNHVDNLVALCRDCHGKKTAMESM